MSGDAIYAPSDPQLPYIRDLCERYGVTPPEAVYSSREASEIITALRTGNYDPGRYVANCDLPWALQP